MTESLTSRDVIFVEIVAITKKCTKLQKNAGVKKKC